MSAEGLPLDVAPTIGSKLAVRGAALAATLTVLATAAQTADAYFWVAIGGAIGSMVRHWSTAVANVLFGTAFPWGTLLINIIGSFVIGLFFAVTGPDGRFDASVSTKVFVMTGLCGGYTTFSAFSLQTLSMFQEGAWLRAGGYVLFSVAFCLLAVWAGYVVGAK
jgi:fluoride exporter